MIENETIVKDALYNLDLNSGSKPEYNRGLVVGLVSGLMATGMAFDSAIKIVAKNLPRDFAEKSLPEAWKESIKANR